MIIGRTKAALISDLTIDQDIAMAIHKLTGLGDGSENDHSANIGQILTAIAAEATARDEAIGDHSDLDTGVHGVGESSVCSETEADTKITTHKGDASAHHTKTPSPTKEFFVPVTYGTEMSVKGTYPAAYCNEADKCAYIGFRVPHDFSSIVTAEIVTSSIDGSATANWDIYSQFAAIGEADNTHAQNDTTSTYHITANEIEVVDISGILSGLAADDYVSIKFVQKEVNRVYVFGVHFEYN